MSADLETRYRRLMAWYPRSWRAANEDAFVGTLLDAADATGRAAPAAGERAAIVGHGVTARLDRVVVPHVRHAGSTIALTMGTGLAFAEFVMTSWAPWIVGNPGPGWLVQIGPFRDTGFVFAGLWLVALVAAVTGRWAVGRIALGVCIVLAAVSPYWFTAYPGVWSVDRATLFLFAACAFVAFLGRPVRGQHTVAASVGWMLVGILSYLSVGQPAHEWLGSRALWDGNMWAWYGVGLLEVVAIGFAVARLWSVAFTIVLGLTPYALTVVANELRGILTESGSAAVVAAPVALGLLLLVLHSSGRLALSDRGRATTDRGRPTTDRGRATTERSRPPLS
ncbi:hypothetical protein [Curtobacterium sp. PhB115]|uniref:hypothetical protein n=1 Tax=Curtobacterium sp. PhB115 TaxID=2485173 RepID=UPI000F4B4B0F|nr:hypothetical protein [Curtobacterium sp. PhB115]ROP74014.1 hypothetical protein EDF19_0087 [Curtobacterium sp. PhB115]